MLDAIRIFSLFDNLSQYCNKLFWLHLSSLFQPTCAFNLLITSNHVVNDLKNNICISQFAGQKGLSTEHDFVKMIDRILGYLERNSPDEICAVLTIYLDFSQAYKTVWTTHWNHLPGMDLLCCNFFQTILKNAKWL